MPNPAKYKDKAKYMEDCMHQTRKVEKLPQGQSVAVCLSRWREEKGGNKPKKKEGTHHLLRNLARMIEQYAI